jgi:glutaredoxin 3
MSMSKPILYVKQGCPWCADALKYFSEVGLELDLVDVRTNPSRMPELEEVSGQTKTPTLKNGDFVVADFDVDEFKEALREKPEEAKKLGLSV